MIANYIRQKHLNIKPLINNKFIVYLLNSNSCIILVGANEAGVINKQHTDWSQVEVRNFELQANLDDSLNKNSIYRGVRLHEKRNST